MECIRIVATPFGEQPPWVRRAFVGLVLPSATYQFDIEQEIRLGRTFTSPPNHLVDTMTAFEILDLQRPKAAHWWRSCTDHDRPGIGLSFGSEVCLDVNTIPGILPPNEFEETGETTLGRLIEQLDSALQKITRKAVPYLLYLIAEYCDWSESSHSPINRILVIHLAQLFVELYEQRAVQCVSDLLLRDTINEGQFVLDQLYKLAVREGILVNREEVCLPIGPANILIEPSPTVRCELGRRAMAAYN